ncbi:uncharacterized protein LOC121730651 [Aricia agestis]|uniref:uncharacterized protein LOC121730651 n=1 Tax=Aricia agestis TaxID=91739 RepID=UPI001C206FD4|nr:uncharacterized protein LOC121730651 [Aricia agestis]
MDENLSDDEIFFGKMSLKEAKKLIFINYPQRQTISYSTTNEEHDEDVRIIETHSEPDLIEVDKSLDSDLNSISSPNIVCNNFKECDLDVKPDDSFIRFEKMVSELCMSPTDKHPKLDNTLEVVDFILNNVEHNKPEVKVLPCLDINLDVDNKTENLHSVEDSNTNDSNAINVQTPKTNLRNENNIECKTVACVTPETKLENSCNIGVGSTDFVSMGNTPKDNVKVENNIRCETTTCDTVKTNPESYNTKVYNTSKVECTTKINNVHNIPEIKHDTNLLSVTPKNKLLMNSNAVFKTPKNPVSSKKVTSAKKTPNRLNTYQHIMSPVASYIKNCPQVPLVKDVHPQRPLPAKSSIPQPIKNVSKTMNKENIEIPTVAYKSAKKTQMVTVPSQEKMPKGEWTSKLTSSLKKPVVITHGQRVANNVAKNLNKRQEDSFANLTLQQAEISVCTKKSAF